MVSDVQQLEASESSPTTATTWQNAERCLATRRMLVLHCCPCFVPAMLT